MVEGLGSNYPGGSRRLSLNEGYLSLVYRAAVEATEEAVLNALFMAETMMGRDGNTREAIPLDRVREIMEKYGRI